MLKIQKFIKDTFDIELKPYQLEVIALLVADNYKRIKPSNREEAVAYKAALAWLQDGLKEVDPHAR